MDVPLLPRPNTSEINPVGHTHDWTEEEEYLDAVEIAPGLSAQIEQKLTLNSYLNHPERRDALIDSDSFPIKNLQRSQTSSKFISTIDAESADICETAGINKRPKLLPSGPNSNEEVQPIGVGLKKLTQQFCKESYHFNKTKAIKMFDLNKRRSRNDPNEELQFICGCGKTYITYQGIYLHAKTKHNGIYPEGTIKAYGTPEGRRSIRGAAYFEGGSFRPLEILDSEDEEVCDLTANSRNQRNKMRTIGSKPSIRDLQQTSEIILDKCAAISNSQGHPKAKIHSGPLFAAVCNSGLPSEEKFRAGLVSFIKDLKSTILPHSLAKEEQGVASSSLMLSVLIEARAMFKVDWKQVEPLLGTVLELCQSLEISNHKLEFTLRVFQLLQNRKLSASLSFALFVVIVHEYAKSILTKEVLIMIVILRICYNQSGPTFYAGDRLKAWDPTKGEFADCVGAEFLDCIRQNFVKEFFPKFISSKDKFGKISKLVYFGLENKEILRLHSMVELFFGFLTETGLLLEPGLGSDHAEARSPQDSVNSSDEVLLKRVIGRQNAGPATRREELNLASCSTGDESSD